MNTYVKITACQARQARQARLTNLCRPFPDILFTNISPSTFLETITNPAKSSAGFETSSFHHRVATRTRSMVWQGVGQGHERRGKEGEGGRRNKTPGVSQACATLFLILFFFPSPPFPPHHYLNIC